MIAFLLHGSTLAFAWFLLFNAAATAAVAIVAPWMANREGPRSPGLWLALRVAPAVISLAFVALVFIPSYWRYEPREDVEGFDVTLTALATLAAAVLVAGFARGVAAWRRAARRADRWLSGARPLALPDATMPAFAIDADAPVMALVGVLRPRLLITRPVLEALSAEELRASVAHEVGHWRAWDNLKRLAMHAAPDLLSGSSAARLIERRWASAAEYAADRDAGRSDGARCALASALVKVARLTPPAASMGEPISALIDGGDIGDIAARVRRLLDDAPSAAAPRRGRWLALAIPACALALAYSPILRLVHGATELLVNGLP